VLAGDEQRLKDLVTAKPDATLAEIREGLPTTAALSTLWLELDRLGLTFKETSRRGLGVVVNPKNGTRHSSSLTDCC
jgi:hypothetical protein